MEVAFIWAWFAMMTIMLAGLAYLLKCFRRSRESDTGLLGIAVQDSTSGSNSSTTWRQKLRWVWNKAQHYIRTATTTGRDRHDSYVGDADDEQQLMSLVSREDTRQEKSKVTPLLPEHTLQSIKTTKQRVNLQEGKRKSVMVEPLEMVDLSYSSKLSRLRGGLGPPQFVTFVEEKSKLILKEALLPTLYKWLPQHLLSADLFLMYSLAQDGSSLHTLYNAVNTDHVAQLTGRGEASKQQKKKLAAWESKYARSWTGASLLLMQDSNGHIFGAFTPEPWTKSERYYGSAESFVFQVWPQKIKYDVSLGKDKNSFYQLGHDDYLAVGGGSHFALWFDAHIKYGSSHPSETFENKTISSTPEFTIHACELWALT
jgi:hypothetical protein